VIWWSYGESIGFKGLMCTLGLNGILSNQVLQSWGETCALLVFYVLYIELHVGSNS
jgi:hypothetical protein